MTKPAAAQSNLHHHQVGCRRCLNTSSSGAVNETTRCWRVFFQPCFFFFFSLVRLVCALSVSLMCVVLNQHLRTPYRLHAVSSKCISKPLIMVLIILPLCDLTSLTKGCNRFHCLQRCSRCQIQTNVARVLGCDGRSGGHGSVDHVGKQAASRYPLAEERRLARVGVS